MKKADIVWEFPPPALAPTLVDAILNSRGVTREELQVNEIPDFGLLPDMDKALDCLREAKEKGIKVGVFGDYDVDGMTATSILVKALNGGGIETNSYVPTREEGFGLTEDFIRKMHADGCRLIITVDNGSDRVNEVSLAQSLGCKVIVTDHHPAHEESFAKADALINVTRKDNKYPFLSLCGAGVAYGLSCKAVEAGIIPERDDLVALAALGTLADVVAIRGVNRRIVQEGMARMRLLPGIAACLEGAGLQDFSSRDLVFRIVPMLNAPGRLSSPTLAVQTLLCEDADEARILARQLMEANAERKRVGARMQADAFAMIDDSRFFPEGKTAIVMGSRLPRGKVGPEEARRVWKHGMVGTLAGRITETYNRPAFILAEDTPGIMKGSCRSVRDTSGEFLPVNKILEEAEGIYQKQYRSEEFPQLFITHGGHSAAAGFSIPTTLYGVFKQCIEQATTPYYQKVPPYARKVADVTWALPTSEELAELRVIEPTGAEFQSPTIHVQNVEVAQIQSYTRSRIITLRQGERSLGAVCFIERSRFTPGSKLDLLLLPHKPGLALIDGFKERERDTFSLGR